MAKFRVELLARHRKAIPLIARWFVEEWPLWYGPSGRGNAVADLESFAGCERSLPIGLLLFEADTPIGAGALKATSIPSHPHLSPWAAAGFVLPQRRRNGAGEFLLRALVSKAQQLGHEHVYCGTSTAESLLLRAGWNAVAVTRLEGKDLTIFRSVAEEKR